MVERYEDESIYTYGYVIDKIRRHSIEEIARAVDVPAQYLESVCLSGDRVGAVLLTKIAHDQGVPIGRILRSE